jgi:DNA polymerase III subunit epsilon
MERFAAIDFEIANGKRSSICCIGVAIIEDNKVIDSVYTLVRPYPNFYTRFTTAIHGITMQPAIVNWISNSNTCRIQSTLPTLRKPGPG